MIYRPNFCCKCGEKIERVEWPLLASRRFCDLCRTEHQVTEWLPRILIVVGFVFGLAGLAASLRQSPKADDLAARSVVGPRSERPQTQKKSDFNATPPGVQQSQPGQNSAVPERQTDQTTLARKQPTMAGNPDPVYYCGAATKKGTPCTRRVKRPGDRCWQHQGMPSMLENAQKLTR